MINFISNIFGVDQKVAIFLSSKIFSYSAYPITLFFLIKYLTPEQQGYFYTFYMLLALSMFLELGLGIVLTNIASHEFAKLKWSKNNFLIGDENSLNRVKSLIKKTILWYLCIASIFFILMIPVGIILFSDISINLFKSWMLLVFVFAPGLVFSPILSILQGFQKIKEVQFVIFLQTFFSIIMFWLGLFFGYGIDALAIQFLVQNTISFIFIIFSYRNLIKSSFLFSGKVFSWRKEVFPLQIKTGLAWAIGYLGLNLMVPFVMKIFGPEIAGQLGMSIRIAEVISVVCLAWTNTRVPQMGRLIAERNFLSFKNLFYRSLKSIVLIGFILLLALFSILYFLELYNYSFLLDRILNIKLIFLLMLGYYSFSISNYLSMSIRAFKVEKMIIPNLISLVCYASAMYFAMIYDNYSIIVATFLATNVAILLPSSIFFIKRQLNYYV